MLVLLEFLEFLDVGAGVAEIFGCWCCWNLGSSVAGIFGCWCCWNFSFKVQIMLDVYDNLLLVANVFACIFLVRTDF